MINHPHFPLQCSQHSQSEIQGMCLESDCTQVVKLFCVNCLLDDQHSKCSKQKKFTLNSLWNQIGNLKLSDSKSTQLGKQWLNFKQEIYFMFENLDKEIIKVEDYLNKDQNQMRLLQEKLTFQNLNISEYHELCSLLLKQCKIENQSITLRPTSDQPTQLLDTIDQYSKQIKASLKLLRDQLINISTNKGSQQQIQPIQPIQQQSIQLQRNTSQQQSSSELQKKMKSMANIPLICPCPPGCACGSNMHISRLCPSCQQVYRINENADIYCASKECLTKCPPKFIQEFAFQCDKSNTQVQFRTATSFLMVIAQQIQQQNDIQDNKVDFSQKINTQLIRRWKR